MDYYGHGRKGPQRDQSFFSHFHFTSIGSVGFNILSWCITNLCWLIVGLEKLNKNKK